MRPIETAARLSAFRGRGAGTDPERRAALFLAQETRSRYRSATVEPFWCRPNWAAAQVWHLVAGIVGSVVMTTSATIGGALVLVALLAVVLDGLTGRSPGRWLTCQRASQNVVSPSPDADRGRPVRLVVTANYDAGRAGYVHRDALRGAAARMHGLAGNGRFTPGWLGWTAIALLWLLAVAVVRTRGGSGTTLGAVQLIPTAGLIVELALLAELALADFGPAAGDNAAGVAVALALVRTLDASPPAHLAVELVLQGAGDGEMTGLRHHLRARRRNLPPAGTVVLGIGPCGAGRPCRWESDGPLVPLGYHRRLRRLAAEASAAAVEGGAATRHRGRGTAPPFPARVRGLPALAIGCVGPHGRLPRSHQAGDVPSALDGAAMDRLLQFALTLVDALDADVAKRSAADPTARRGPAPATV